MLNEHVSTTKLDAPYLTWSIGEENQTKELDRGVSRTKVQDRRGNDARLTAQKKTKPKMVRNAVKRSKILPFETKSESLDDFVEPMSTVPIHQRVDIMGARSSHHHQNRRRQAMLSSDVLAIKAEEAESNGHSGGVMGNHEDIGSLGKRESTRSGSEVADIQLSMFRDKLSRMQSRNRRVVEYIGNIQEAMEHPGTDGKDVAYPSRQQSDNTATAESDGRNHTYLEFRKQPGIRVRKHIARQPTINLLGESHSMAREPHFGRIIRRTNVEKEPHTVVRKHLANVAEPEQRLDLKALNNSEMAQGGIKGHRNKKPRKVQDTQITNHSSQVAPSSDARAKAMRLHKLYQVPLQDEKLGDLPRP